MSATTPYIWVAAGDGLAYVDSPQPGGGRVWLDTPAWFAWLDAAATVRFAYPLIDPTAGYIVGVMTVRKERRTRGGAYWTAYRRAGARLHKAYVGRTPAVTQSRLAALAQVLLQARGGGLTHHEGAG